MTQAPRPHVGRWILGGVAFLIAAGILFEAKGMSLAAPARLSRLSPRSASSPAAIVKAYRPVSVDDGDVHAALQFALTDQKQKNRSSDKLLAILTAERQASAGVNFRLCLSLDRRGRAETARVVVHRNQKQRWLVALWAWGACGKEKKGQGARDKG